MSSVGGRVGISPLGRQISDWSWQCSSNTAVNTTNTSVFTIDNECNSDNYDVSDSKKDKDKDEDNNKHKENDSDILTSTIGFNVESVNHKGINFTLWDVGGLPKIRHLWPHYYANNDAVIFVVDSQDQVRLPEAK